MKRPAEVYHRSRRRLNDHDKKIRYPATHEAAYVSESGHLWHKGHNYHLGEAFADCCVGLWINTSGQTELHFANLHLGNLVYDPAERFRPAAYIVPPDHKPLAKSYIKTKQKV